MVKIQNLVSKATAEIREQLRQQLAQPRQLYVDESPTRQQNKNARLCVALAPMFAVFGIYDNRKRDSLRALVGDYSNVILNCDRAKMYLDANRLQWCWAHLKRDIQKLIGSSDGRVRRLGHDLKREQRKIFELWYRYRQQRILWSTFQRRRKPIGEQFNSYLLHGACSGIPRSGGKFQGLHENRYWLWKFDRVHGIEPMNNTAERAL